MQEPKYLPGSDFDNLGDAFAEMARSFAAEEGDIEVMVDTTLALLERYFPGAINVLFTRIKHGDSAHQQWLFGVMDKWTKNEDVSWAPEA